MLAGYSSRRPIRPRRGVPHASLRPLGRCANSSIPRLSSESAAKCFPVSSRRSVRSSWWVPESGSPKPSKYSTPSSSDSAYPSPRHSTLTTCLPSDHPLNCGRPATIGDRAGNIAVQNSDLLLVLGCRLNIRQISYNWKAFARAAFKIQVDIDPAEFQKPTVKPDLPFTPISQLSCRSSNGNSPITHPPTQRG